VDKTCKSNDCEFVAILIRSSGERVCNTWVIFRKVWHNALKSALILDMLAEVIRREKLGTARPGA
jgi:hypothetical protein